ncbi:MAG: DnaD domain protein [Lactobacillaceae bacterium]
MTKRKIKAYNGFLVTNINYFSDFSQQVLTDLYLPIIGAKSYTLYLYFWSLTKKKLVSMDRFEHTRIINALGISLDDLNEALLHLEGIGLLRTFLKKDIIGLLFLYELSSPVSPETFFKDNLLTSYLKEMVGTSIFEDLKEKYTLHPVNTKNFTEITASFSDVYQFNSVSLNPDKISLNFQKSRTPSNNEFDQNLFLTLISKFDLDKELIKKNLDEFEEIAQFYQLNELELVNALVSSHCFRKNQFQINYLTNFLNQKITLNKSLYKRNNSSNNSDKIDENLLKNLKLDISEKNIITQAKSCSPLQFLTKLKEQLGGYITNSEAAIIRKLSRRQILDDQVINIMIYYELKNNPTITEHLTDTLANDWSQKRIQKAEDALIYVKNFKNKKKKSSYSLNKTSKPIPKWFDEKDTTQNKLATDHNLDSLIKTEEKRRKRLDKKG